MTNTAHFVREPLFDTTISFQTENGDFEFERMDDITLSQLKAKLKEDDNRSDDEIIGGDCSSIDKIFFHNTQKEIKKSDIRDLTIDTSSKYFNGLSVNSKNKQFIQELNTRSI